MEDMIVAGAVVVVKSGGPALTVGSVERGQVFCHWFDDEGRPQSAILPQTVLELYDPSEEE